MSLLILPIIFLWNIRLLWALKDLVLILRLRVAAVVKHLGDSTIKTSVLDGKTSEAILQYAAEYKADLVVMGAHSHNGLGKIMGDVAAKVIKHAEIPVLIVPADKQELGLVSKKQDTLQCI